MKKFIFFLIPFCTFITYSSAQTEKEVNVIIQDYDTLRLQEMQNQFFEQHQRDKFEAEAFAKQRGIKTTIISPNKSYAELQRVLPDGTLIYYKTNNVDAAISTRTNHINTGGSTGFNLDGQNMIAYVWDGGHPLESHLEYDGIGGNDRVNVIDAIAEGGLDLNYHAAHVVGTIGAAGVIGSGIAKGMAPFSQVKSYKWNQDLSEATTASLNGMLISNHSYSYFSSDLPDFFFGAYETSSEDWDDLHYLAPYYLMVVAAGNDGSTSFNDTPLNPNFPQYDKLTGMTTSKNNMVVANANDANVDVNGNLIEVVINLSSSQGPTDDFRIKPDITGNGTDLTSTFESSDTALGTISGTSMASPNVAGSLLLLQQHHNSLYNTFMLSSTLKGLALHTADDAGMNGPDATFGWGLLNTKRAAETLSEKGVNTEVEEIQLLQGETYTMTVDSDGINNLLASISWTDPAGTATTNLNDTSARLVNDLDIRVTQCSSVFYPWRLTGVNTNANDADNIKDNFERVDVIDASGSYTITVTHKGTLSAANQYFSLVVTGLTNLPTVCSAPKNITIDNITSNTADLSWCAEEAEANGYEWVVMATGVEPDAVTAYATGSTGVGVTSANLTELVSNTIYDVYVRTDCGIDVNGEWSNIVSFVTICDALILPFTEDFESAESGSNSNAPNCWNFIDEGAGTTYVIDGFANSGSQSYRMNNDTDDTGNYMLISPEIAELTTTGIQLIYSVMGSSGEDLEIGTMSDFNDASTFTLLSTLTLPNAGYNDFELDIEAGTDSYVAFRHGLTANFVNFFIDDIGFIGPLTCSIPENISFNNLTESSVDVSWDPSPSEDGGYEYVIVPSGDAVGTGIPVFEASSSLTINDLTSQTEYDFYVRTICGDVNSVWSTVESFTTGFLSNINFDQLKENIHIYPNPIDEVLNIKTTLSINSIEIYTTLGQVVKSIKSKSSIPLSDLKSGLYFLKISTESGTLTTKIIKR